MKRRKEGENEYKQLSRVTLFIGKFGKNYEEAQNIKVLFEENYSSF